MPRPPKLSGEDEEYSTQVEVLINEYQYFEQSIEVIDALQGWWEFRVGGSCIRYPMLSRANNALGGPNGFLPVTPPDLFLIRDTVDIPVEYKHGLSTEEQRNHLRQQLQNMSLADKVKDSEQLGVDRPLQAQCVPIVAVLASETVRAQQALAVEPGLQNVPLISVSPLDQGIRRMVCLHHVGGSDTTAFHALLSGARSIGEWFHDQGINIEQDTFADIRLRYRLINDTISRIHKVEVVYECFRRTLHSRQEDLTVTSGIIISHAEYLVALQQLYVSPIEVRLVTDSIDYVCKIGIVTRENNNYTWNYEIGDSLISFASDIIARLELRNRRQKKAKVTKGIQEVLLLE